MLRALRRVIAVRRHWREPSLNPTLRRVQRRQRTKEAEIRRDPMRKLLTDFFALMHRLALASRALVI
jgi:hypothetical protein